MKSINITKASVEQEPFNDDKYIEKDPIITIYCKKWCEYLQNLVNLLQKNERTFMFINLEYDPDAGQKMLSVLGSPLILPVLEINGIYYEKPNYPKLAEALDLTPAINTFEP